MAQIPNLEMNLAIVDADKLLDEVREILRAARRAYLIAMVAWFTTGVIGTLALIVIGRHA